MVRVYLHQDYIGDTDLPESSLIKGGIIDFNGSKYRILRRIFKGVNPKVMFAIGVTVEQTGGGSE